jgi:hypothetical protein
VKPASIHEAAQLELAESVAFYERRQTGLGLEFEAATREGVDSICQSPERCPLRKDGSRRYIMRRFPVIIHYFIMSDYVWIVAFAHASRRPGYWRRRLGID